MAKAPIFDFCMFCDQSPCVCNKKVKAPPKPRKKAAPKVAPVAAEPTAEPAPDASFMDEPIDPPPRPRSSAMAAMQAAAARSQARPTALPSERPPMIDAEAPVSAEQFDVVTKAAIQALEPVLHPATRREYRKVLAQPVTPAERAQLWRDRRTT